MARPTSYRCERCGAESARAQGFVRQNSFGRARRWRCRPCLALERDRAFPSQARWIAGLGIVAGALLIALPPSRLPWLHTLAAIALNLAVLPLLLLPLVILVHEAGHWLAARALGFDVHSVQIGTGRMLAQLRWFGVPVSWSENPVLGMVRCTVRGGSLLRIRRFLMLSAGLVTHALWIWLAVAASERFGHSLFDPADGFRPLASLAWVNGWLLLGNLLPLRVGELLTDGAQILALPFLRRAQRDALVAQRWSEPARLALAEGQPAQAQSPLEEGLRRFPTDLALQMLQAAAAIQVGEHERAQEQLRRLRARPDLDDVQRAVVANDLAWNLHVRGRSQDLADADAFSREAQQLLGEHPAVMSTRGAVLVDLGRAEEAWSLLANALEKTNERLPRALVLCDLARAEHLLGRPTVASTRLEEARALEPSGPLLARAEAELASPPRTPAAPAPASGPPAPESIAPAPRGRALHLPAWLALGAVGAFAWNCAPSLVVDSVLGQHVWHDPATGPASPAVQQECRYALDRLAAVQAAGAWLPPFREVWDSYALSGMRVNLLECIGDVAAARAALEDEIAWSEALLPTGPIVWEAGSEPAAALVLPHRLVELAALEERAGDGAATLAALERARAISRKLDGGAWGPSATTAAVALGGYLARSGGLDRAREFYREELRAAEAAHSEEWALLPLLQAYAEVLEQSGRSREATEVFARIGRADLYSE